MEGNLSPDSSETAPNVSSDAGGKKAKQPQEKDYWAMSGDCLIRYILEPRKEMFYPSEENMPFPLKWIDVSRVTYTNLSSQPEA